MKTAIRPTCVHQPGKRAFTLVELLVSISIIGLLIAILIPAVSAIRNSANVTAMKSMFNAIDSALGLFRNEQALGGGLPPSSGDVTDPAEARWKIADPQATSAVTAPNTPVAGAHLLLQALIGQDLLGTPGFRDIDRDGFWANDTHSARDNTNPSRSGLYALNDDREPIHTRYGSSGGGYVDENMKTRNSRTLQQLEERGVIALWPEKDDKTAKLNLFVDRWDRPILYYRANRGGKFMIQGDSKPGIYRQEDNAVITGSANGKLTLKGIDFGGSAQDPGSNAFSKIANAQAPERDADKDKVAIDLPWENTFARYILDPQQQQQKLNLPVNRDGYLLISAGPDGIYGNKDDVVNWTREDE